MRAGALAAHALLGLSCGTTLAQGEIGTPRVVGFIRGAPPNVQVLAPSVDRGGNLYLLAGRRDFPDTTVFVGRAGGGFSSGCRLTKGDTVGPIGWVGFASATRETGLSTPDLRRVDRQWYWSGAALVRVTSFGDCRRVLDRDPSTGSDLLFDAVIPWVNDTSGQTSLVALVRAAADALPFTIRVDLNANIFTTPRGFEPASARKVVVHGAGAAPASGEGFVLLSYEDGESITTEVRYYNVDGDLVARAPVDGTGERLAPYSIRGFLQADAGGLGAGLLTDGRIVLFDRARGRVVGGPDMDAVGLHAWEGALYVVGTARDGGGPAIAPIAGDGTVGAPRTWSASASAAQAFGTGIDATDDRAPPRRTQRFEPVSSTGRAPFLTEHSSYRYAEGTTLVTIAGPTTGEGDSAFTLVAVAPAGITYP